MLPTPSTRPRDRALVAVGQVVVVGIGFVPWTWVSSPSVLGTDPLVADTDDGTRS
jgi:hypothetical protein